MVRRRLIVRASVLLPIFFNLSNGQLNLPYQRGQLPPSKTSLNQILKDIKGLSSSSSSNKGQQDFFIGEGSEVNTIGRQGHEIEYPKNFSKTLSTFYNDYKPPAENTMSGLGNHPILSDEKGIMLYQSSPSASTPLESKPSLKGSLPTKHVSVSSAQSGQSESNRHNPTRNEVSLQFPRAEPSHHRRKQDNGRLRRPGRGLNHHITKNNPRKRGYFMEKPHSFKIPRPGPPPRNGKFSFSRGKKASRSRGGRSKSFPPPFSSSLSSFEQSIPSGFDPYVNSFSNGYPSYTKHVSYDLPPSTFSSTSPLYSSHVSSSRIGPYGPPPPPPYPAPSSPYHYSPPTSYHSPPYLDPYHSAAPAPAINPYPYVEVPQIPPQVQTAAAATPVMTYPQPVYVPTPVLQTMPLTFYDLDSLTSKKKLKLPNPIKLVRELFGRNDDYPEFDSVPLNRLANDIASIRDTIEGYHDDYYYDRDRRRYPQAPAPTNTPATSATEVKKEKTTGPITQHLQDWPRIFTAMGNSVDAFAGGIHAVRKEISKAQGQMISKGIMMAGGGIQEVTKGMAHVVTQIASI